MGIAARPGARRPAFRLCSSAQRTHVGPLQRPSLLRAGIEKETEGVTPVSTRHGPQQFPLHPYTLRHLVRFPVGSSYTEIRDRVVALAQNLRGPAVVLDATGVGAAAVSLFRSGSLYVSTVTLVAGDQAAQDGSNYRVPKKDLVSVTQVLLQTGRLKIARALPHAELLARELVNFRSRAPAQTVEAQLDCRERANDDLVLALAIAAWQAEKNPGLGFSVSYGVSEMDGWGGI
jgi:hypothetical protein